MRNVVVCVVALLALSASVDARAQQLQPPPQQPQQRSPEWAMERMTRERWMHGAQLPRFTSFGEARTFLEIDSIRRTGDLRRMDITLQRVNTGRDSAVITSDAAGRVVRLEAGFAPRESPLGNPGMSERFARVGLDGRMTLPAPRAWDLVVTFPQNPRQGSRWTDTIAQSTTDGGYSQTTSGRRTSSIVRDTTIDGQQLWLVRDSARVTFEERRPEHETTVSGETQISRTVSGIVRGVYLYDPASQLTRRRMDTTNLSGDAVLRYADGRVFRTRARYERIRTWQLHDSIQYKARRAALRRESSDQMGGLVRVAETDVQRRLQRGDTALRDSLIGALWRSADGDQARELHWTLTRWWRSEPGFRQRLDSIRVAVGDSAHSYSVLMDRAYSSSPFSVADVHAMIRFLEDPAKAWALNASRDYLYQNLVQGLTTWPLAAPGSGGRTACAPDACQLLGRYRTTAREPRMRDVALVALFTTDPATWADTVLRIGGQDHPLLRSSVALARGVGANWESASKLALPPPDSDWRAWLQWMDGRAPEYQRQQLANVAKYGWPIDTAARVRFEQSHRTALRMHMVITRRDVVGELQRGYDRATNDTAQQVFGTLLDGLDALELTEPQLAEAFSSGQPGRTALARRVMQRSFANATPMPDSLAAPLVDRLLSFVIDTAQPWRNLIPNARQRGRSTPELHARRGRVRLSNENLPPTIRDKWAGRIEIVTRDQVRGGDLREQAATYTVAPIVRVGRFVRVTINASEQMTRTTEQAPVLYASGTTYYLMQLGDEWVIVAMDAWVT